MLPPVQRSHIIASLSPQCSSRRDPPLYLTRVACVDTGDSCAVGRAILTSLAERTSGYFRVLRIPIFLGLAAVGLLAAYYSIYVRDRADYLTGRNLRLVADLGRQIEASLADHATVLASFSTYYGADLFANDFACVAELAGPYVPMFEYVSLAGGASAGAASSPPCKAIDTFKRSDSPPASSGAAPVLFLERDSGVAW